ncbi:8ec96993-4bc2-44b1-bda7-8ba71ac522fb [Thermothielavioides terrestris]|uniref:8ec96993-4bc2-44b1-bda7-8ba71ac522fb n=1 Tax=Thermothielavioides terrestris TaxID=2587410 RepID=A0A3S4AWS2_9PEZI|nr:8ec96993-4bc2-44b1-bda7-8ba71ac522fb [Thermothielavioides terrestris]
MESSRNPKSPSPAESAPPSSVSSSTTSLDHVKRLRGRDANVYDAVAGRITLNEALSDAETANGRGRRRLKSTAGRYSSRNPKLAPEEALFRRKNAPVRYAEQDIYWANEDLPDGGLGYLPDSGLLKSVHGYASRFYEAAAARLGPKCVVGTRIVDERSMDETALLAFGILLEEASRDALGKRDDLVFTEASMEPKAVTGVAAVQETPRMASAEAPRLVGEASAAHQTRKVKRRKVAKEESLDDK